MPRDSLIGPVHLVTPSGLGAWERCRRRYLLGQLLRLPRSDPGPGADDGNLAHDLLRYLHSTGSCHDEAHVDDVLAGHGKHTDPVARGFVERHRRRCPPAPEAQDHERSVARFHRGGMFMATARLDALWRHDGFYDVRDYKTGRPGVERLADDARARLQAWLVAARAARRGLRVRVRYEYLAPEVDDDPEPFEPDDDDLSAIEAELVTVAAAMRAEREWHGVAEREVCRMCEYRSICTDSAAPSEPAWPTPTNISPARHPQSL